MVSDFYENSPRSRRASGWLIAEYAVLDRRLDLIRRYNDAAGTPSAAVAHVHDDFIKDRMEPEELVAFVQVCEGLIAAATKRRAGGGR